MNSTRLSMLVFILMLLTSSVDAQLSDYGFQRNYSIVVRDSTLHEFQRAWNGGMNGCHYNEIDIDQDGIKDLVVFDKTGDCISCYKNLDIDDSVSYTYMPEWSFLFPPVTGWMQLKDYNCDGKEDLFAYAPAGIQVWENVSDTMLKFRLVTPLLNSYQGSGYSNIGLTYVDYPGIADIDGDGDLDILVFFGLGAYVIMHRNNSMELYGNCDTLLFERTFNCWGDFAESASNNHTMLDISCPWKSMSDAFSNLPKGISKHTGSTMLLFDVNNDSVQDLVLGDVDYMNLILLSNVGTRDTAHIGSADTLFPSESIPVDLVSFPLASYIDINNDRLRDLLVSPFDPNVEVPESFHSNWLYKNVGSPQIPFFSWEQGDFLQGEMIEVGTGAHPVLVDVNGDGIDDLLVANYGYLDSTYYQTGYLKSVFRSKIAYFQNTGSLGNPEYTLVTRDYGNLGQLGYRALVPTFADLDNDGDKDMICGEKDGTLLYFQNTAGSGNMPLYSAPVASYMGIDVGEYSAPVLIDLNSDGLKDLVIGKKNGMLCWYKNTGTVSNPSFSMEKDTLGGVNVTDYMYSYSGYSTPTFFRDSTGALKLFVGSERGRIYYYKDIETNLYGNFTSVDSVLVYIGADSLIRAISDGYRSAAAVADLNTDGRPDLITGNYRGGLCYYQGGKPLVFSSVEEQAMQEESSMICIYPNPAADYLIVAADVNDAKTTMRFVLTDLSGRVMMDYQMKMQGINRINTQQLQSGLYLYRVTAANRIQTGKLIITR